MSTLTSCKDELKEVNSLPTSNSRLAGRTERSSSPVGIENGRLVFATFSDFLSFRAEQSSKSAEELAAWEQSMGYTSLRTFAMQHTEDENFYVPRLPYSTIPVVNQNSEVQVGDTVLWYAYGNRYHVHKNDVALLSALKQDTSIVVNKYETVDKTVGTIDENGGFTTNAYGPRVRLKRGDTDARHQKEYSVRGNIADKRKITYEIGYEAEFVEPEGSIYGVGGWANLLYTRAKLEYLGKCGWWFWEKACWRPAGEPRQVSINATLEGTIDFRFYPGGLFPIGGYVSTYEIPGVMTTSKDVKLTTVNIQTSFISNKVLPIDNGTSSSNKWFFTPLKSSSPKLSWVKPDANVNVSGTYSTQVLAPNHTLGVYNGYFVW
jgi:hypothetical protein